MRSLTKRDFLKLGSSSLLSLALARFFPTASPPGSQPIIYHGSSRFDRVALTYDDCYLVKMLNELEAALALFPEARVTLFPVGEALLNNQTKDPGVWKRFHERGHEFGYHSFDHTNPQLLSAQEVIDDYDHWLDALTSVLETDPQVRFARPPFGITSDSFLEMCAARGLVPTMWSTGWGGPTERVIISTVPKLRRGDIVLLHTRPEDMDTTNLALPELYARGIAPVTLSRLYLDLVREQHQADGCETGPLPSPVRTCID